MMLVFLGQALTVGPFFASSDGKWRCYNWISGGEVGLEHVNGSNWLRGR
jgi:hypothetical protein